jgi:hypothetical protein
MSVDSSKTNGTTKSVLRGQRDAAAQAYEAAAKAYYQKEYELNEKHEETHYYQDMAHRTQEQWANEKKRADKLEAELKAMKEAAGTGDHVSDESSSYLGTADGTNPFNQID